MFASVCDVNTYDCESGIGRRCHAPYTGRVFNMVANLIVTLTGRKHLPPTSQARVLLGYRPLAIP